MAVVINFVAYKLTVYRTCWIEARGTNDVWQANMEMLGTRVEKNQTYQDPAAYLNDIKPVSYPIMLPQVHSAFSGLTDADG